MSILKSSSLADLTSMIPCRRDGQTRQAHCLVVRITDYTTCNIKIPAVHFKQESIGFGVAIVATSILLTIW